MLTYWLHRHISVCHLHSMTPLQLEYIRKVKSLLSAVITRTLVTPHLFVWPDTGYQFCGDNRSAVTVYLLLPFNCSFKCFFTNILVENCGNFSLSLRLKDRCVILTSISVYGGLMVVIMMFAWCWKIKVMLWTL